MHIGRRRARGCCFSPRRADQPRHDRETSPDRLGTYAQERGWRNLRLLSSRNNTFNRDYHAEAPDGGQLPVLNVFSRDQDGIHHHWASEMMTFKRATPAPSTRSGQSTALSI